MEREKILQATYLDLIFDKRNKAYGGYELRKNYPKRTRNALVIVLLATAVGFAIPAIAGSLKKPVIAMAPPAIPKTPVLTPIDPARPPKAIKTPAVAALPKPIKSIVFSPPVILMNNEVHPAEQLVHNDQIKNAQISYEQHDGDPSTSDISLTNATGTGSETGNLLVGSGDGPVDNKPHTYVEQMPVFNGDVNAYLNSHLQYPDAAREANIQGRTIVQFVVNEDGSVSDAEVKRSASPLLDKEALRVVMGMPHWKPGKQNGKAVKVYFTLPITFRLD